MQAALRAHPEVSGVVAAADDVTRCDGHTWRLFLGNHFAETREMSREQRRARLDSVLDAGTSPRQSSWEDAREELLLVIRSGGFGRMAAHELPAGARPSAEMSLVRRSFLPGLDVLAVRDTPKAMDYVTSATLQRWAVDADEVLAAAQARVTSMLADPRIELHDQVHGPLWSVATGDTYESSRLLVPGWLASLRNVVEGRPVAIVPERGILFVGGDQRPEMIQRLAQMAEKEFSSSPRSVSCALYTVDDDGEVVPYLPQPPHPCAGIAGVGHAELALREHQQQKAQLEAAPEPKEDIFVATYLAFQTPEGVVRSRAVWTEGVLTLLPETNFVMLVTMDEKGERALSRVDVPFAVIADRLTLEPGLTPARDRTGVFPDAATLRELHARHVGAGLL